MNNAKILQDAIIKNGKCVLQEVTSILYKGGFCRPDVYFEHALYKNLFDEQQRQVIEKSGYKYLYNMKTAGDKLDLIIHFKLIERACDLTPYDSLYMLSLKLIDKLNDNLNAITNKMLNDNLDDLCNICIKILSTLETDYNIDLSTKKIMVKDDIMKWNTTFENGFLGTLSKFALDIGVLSESVAGIISLFEDNEKENEEKKYITADNLRDISKLAVVVGLGAITMQQLSCKMNK